MNAPPHALKRHIVPSLLAVLLSIAACTEPADTGASAEALYAQGMASFEQGGEPALREAIDLFSRAIAADSAFAPAWAGLSRAYTNIGGNFNIMPPEESWPRAREAADMAMRLDDSLAESHLARAYVLEGADWDWAGAELAFQRALEIEPANIEALTGYAWFLHNLGRSEQARPYAERANELAARPVDAFLTYVVTGDVEGQIAAAGEAITAAPGDPNGYWVSALIHAWEGEYERAAERLEQQIPLMNGDVVDEVALLGYVYARMGRTDDARAMLERLDEVAAAGRYVSPVLKAWIYSGLGETAEAVRWLRLGFEARAHRSGLDMNSFSEVYAPIRENSGFQQLLEEMGLAG